MKYFSTGLTTIVVVIIILAFGFIKPMPTEASEVAQIDLLATPYLVVESIKCTSHVQVHFVARNLPDNVTDHGVVNYILNSDHRQADFEERIATTARYDEWLAPYNGTYLISSATVTITTSTGSFGLSIAAPYEKSVVCQSPVTATPTATLTATNTATNTPTLAVTATPTGTVDPTVSPTATLTATNTPTGTLEVTPTPTSTSDDPVTATPTTDIPSPTPTIDVTPTVNTTPGPQFDQCLWMVPGEFVGGTYYVQEKNGGPRLGETYKSIEYKPENGGGGYLWIYFDKALAGVEAEIVYEPTGVILISFQFLFNGQGNDLSKNCRTETEVDSGPTPTPVPSICDSDCGSAKQESIPPGGAVIVNYYLCSNGDMPPCGALPLVENTLYQSEIPFAVIVNGMKLEPIVVNNLRGDFYILDRIPTSQGRELVNPDGSPFTGPLSEYDSCSIWPTFARLNGTTMQYWKRANRSDIGAWLRDESGIAYETTFAFANQLSQQPWPMLVVPAEILAGLEP